MGVVDVLDALDPQLVGLADYRPALDAGSGQPHHHGVLVVVAPGTGAEEVHGVVGGSSEFTSPDHQGLVEQAPLLEVLEQGGDGPVGLHPPLLVLSRDVLVGIPAAAVNLHEAHAALHQAPGHQALACHGLADLVVEAIHFPNLPGFAVEVQTFGNRGLHAEGQLVVSHAGQEIGISGMDVQVGSIELVQQLQILFLAPGRDFRRRTQVDDGVSFRVEQRSLGGCRQVAVGPVDGTAEDPGPGVGQDHEGRQVLILGSQAEDGPGAHRGTARYGDARVHEKGGRGMGLRTGVHGPHYRNVIGAGPKFGEHVGHLDSRLPVPLELEGAAHVHPLFQASVLAEDGLAVELVQLGLGIEGVHLAGSSLHEHEDAGLGLGCEVGLLGEQGIFGPGRGSQPAVAVEERGEGQASQSLAEPVDKISPAHLAEPWIEPLDLVAEFKLSLAHDDGYSL